MNIKDLENDFIEKKMKQSAKSQDVTSWSNFQMGWRSAIRFAKKVEKADFVCNQCGKMIEYKEVEIDTGGTPFCEKCYQKVFGK